MPTKSAQSTFVHVNNYKHRNSAKLCDYNKHIYCSQNQYYLKLYKEMDHETD
jgi:hypothetical protein